MADGASLGPPGRRATRWAARERSVRSSLCREDEEGARNDEHRDPGDKDPGAPPHVAVDPTDQDEDRRDDRQQGQEWIGPHARRHLVPPSIAAAPLGPNMLDLPT